MNAEEEEVRPEVEIRADASQFNAQAKALRAAIQRLRKKNGSIAAAEQGETPKDAKRLIELED